MFLSFLSEFIRQQRFETNYLIELRHNLGAFSLNVVIVC